MYCRYMFNCLRNCESVFQSSCTILHFFQQCMRISLALHPHQNLDMDSLLNFIHSRGYLPLFHCGVIDISLMINDVEHLFMCLFPIFITSLLNYLFRSFDHLKNWVVFLSNCKNSLYILDTGSLSDMYFAFLFFLQQCLAFSFL